VVRLNTEVSDSRSDASGRLIIEAGDHPSADRRFWVLPFGLFLIALGAGAIVGLFVYRSAQQSLISYVDLNLDAVARLKADQAYHWLEEIEEGIEVGVHRYQLANAIYRWRDTGAASEGAPADELVGWLARLCGAAQTTDCSLHAPADGKLWISYGFGSDSDLTRSQAMAASGQSEPQLEDFHISHSDQSRPEIGYFYGVRSNTPPYESIAVVHVTADSTELFRILAVGWPGLNRSFEVVLLQRDGTRSISQIPERDTGPQVSVGKARGPSAVGLLAVRGTPGLLKGVDERSVPVFAHALPVFGTPWFVMTKLDQSEAFGQLNAIATLSATAFSTIMLIGCLAWTWRRWHLLSLNANRLERLMLTRRIDYLARYASDCIILSDADGLILEVNDRAALSYGYATLEMKSMHLIDLLPESARAQFQDLLPKLQSQGSLIYEAEQRRKDGGTFPAEVSASLIDTDGKRFLQAIVRDVSERRTAETERENHLARQQELSRRLMTVQEHERRRISAELHDSTVASLAAVKLNLNAIAKALPASSELGTSIIAETRSLLSETIEQVRELCADLRPSVLDRMGLAAAIGSSAQQLKLRTGMDVDVQCDEFDKRFAGDVESMFFRITQEALRNCAKHANAKSVEIRLARSAEWIKLTIADDGVGFELDRLEQFANAGGLGLSTMRERAEFAGAQFEITSSSAHGTRIRVWLESDKAFGAAP